MTYLIVVSLGNFFNPSDPIFDVWLEMSDVWILPRRHDENAGKETMVIQAGMPLREGNRTRRR